MRDVRTARKATRLRGAFCLRRRGSEGGFTFVELLVALTLLSTVALIVLQAFIVGMGHAGRSNEKMAASTLAIQIMEHIRGSANPYMLVGIADVPRSTLPMAAPYSGIVNPTVHPLEVAIDLTQNTDLGLITATVQIYRPSDTTGSPFVTMTTILDDQ